MRIGERTYSRTEVMSLVGDIGQLASVTWLSYEDGAARGSRLLQIRATGGITFDVLVDRGLDIGWAEVDGSPLAWRSPRGPTAPALAEPDGNGWTRTFGGGLLTTCGMMTIGASAVDGEEHLGLHGRVSHLPAEEVSYSLQWDADDLDILIKGRVTETSLGGPTLERRREIRTRVGTPHLSICDVVTNTGAVDAPHMYRFHANFGFPFLQPGDEIGGGGELTGWRADAPATTRPWTRLASPTADARPEVLYLTPKSIDGDVTNATVSVRRPGMSPHLVLEWSQDTLPMLVVWKHQQTRTNVVALEPSTARDEGRPAARRAGELITLQPDQSRSYRLHLRCQAPTTDTIHPQGETH